MKTIYILRSQCNECKLDKMETFYSFGDGVTPTKYINQMKPHIRRAFREKYGCTHGKSIKFTREVDTEYLWDEEKNQPVKRALFK